MQGFVTEKQSINLTHFDGTKKRAHEKGPYKSLLHHFDSRKTDAINNA